VQTGCLLAHPASNVGHGMVCDKSSEIWGYLLRKKRGGLVVGHDMLPLKVLARMTQQVERRAWLTIVIIILI
jgi:hypothetical protein